MGMIIDFTGKTVLVTGGGRGLGKDMALLFAECGAKVMIAGRGISHLEQTMEEICATGAQGLYRACDVSKSEDVEALVKDAVALGGGKLDVVVHAAGVPVPLQLAVAPSALRVIGTAVGHTISLALSFTTLSATTSAYHPRRFALSVAALAF